MLKSVYLDNQKQRFTKIQNEKEFRIQPIETQCFMFSLYQTFHKIESAIEGAIKTNTK